MVPVFPAPQAHLSIGVGIALGVDAFEGIVSTFDGPMFVVTARADDEQDGCLVGFTTQCSIDPPRFLVCLSEKNRTTRIAPCG